MNAAQHLAAAEELLERTEAYGTQDHAWALVAATAALAHATIANVKAQQKPLRSGR